MSKLGGDYTDELVDIGALICPLWAYSLTSASGTATLTGIFVDAFGIQVGAAFSYAITTGTTITALYNTANSVSPSTTPLPSAIVGVIGTLSGAALFMGRSGLPAGTIASGQTPASGYPQIATSNFMTLGRTSPQP